MDNDNLVLISLSRDDFQSIVIDSVNSCLKYNTAQHEESKEELLILPGVSTLLNLADSTIYGLVHRGEIPHHKKGGRLYFLRSELLDWIKSGRRKTLAEIEAEPEQYLKPLKKRRS